MRIVFGLFEEIEHAKEAVMELLDVGFELGEMNAIVQEAVAKIHLDVNRQEAKVETNNKIDGIHVYGLSALFNGQHALSIPDIGTVYAAGSIAVTLAGAASSRHRVGKGMLGALEDFDIPPATSKLYRDGVAGGQVLFWIRTDDNKAGIVISKIKRHHADDVVTLPR